MLPVSDPPTLPGQEISQLAGQPPHASLVAAAAAPRKTVNRRPEICFAGTVLVLVFIRVFDEAQLFHLHPGASWNLSEWMISYADGFVRRGLGGSLLAGLVRFSGIGLLPLWTTLSVVSYLTLCAWLLRLLWTRGGPALWRYALLFHPLLLLSFCDSLMRKDVLFLWGTLLHIFAGEHFLTAPHRTRRLRSAILFLSVTAGCSLFLALLHEGIFLFAWFPLNAALAAWVLSQLGLRRQAGGLLLLLAFAPALVGTAASVLRHGDLQTAQAICRGWQFAVPEPCTSGPAFPPAIDALTWSFSRGLSLSFGYVWRFPAFVLMFLIAGAVQISAVRALFRPARLDHLLTLLLVPFFFSLPLFALGVDWGRWLALLASSSLLVMFSEPLRPCVFSLFPLRWRNRLTGIVEKSARPALARFHRGIEHHPVLFIWALLLLRIPPIPVPTALLLNPPVILLKFVLRLASSH